MLEQWMGLPGLSLDLGSTKIYSGNKAALVYTLRKQGNTPNFGGSECGNLEKHFWDNKTFVISAESDQPAHPHERGRYNLHADCTI